MSISSSIGGNPLPFAAGETLGPQFKQLTSALDDATRGLKGFTPALMNVTGALQGFASSTGGMKPLGQAFELLSSTVGVVVAPAFVLLAVAVATAATTLMEELEPNLDRIADWYSDHYDSFMSFGEAVVSATHFLNDMAQGKSLREATGISHTQESDVGLSIGTAIGTKLFGIVPGLIGGTLLYGASRAGMAIGNSMASGEMSRAQAESDRLDLLIKERDKDPKRALDSLWAKADQEDPRFMAKQVRRAASLDMLHGMIAGMKQDLGGAPGFRRIEDAWRQNQMAAFESPMQAMIRKNAEKLISLLEKIEAHERSRLRNAAPNVVQGGNAAAGR